MPKTETEAQYEERVKSVQQLDWAALLRMYMNPSTNGFPPWARKSSLFLLPMRDLGWVVFRRGHRDLSFML